MESELIKAIQFTPDWRSSQLSPRPSTVLHWHATPIQLDLPPIEYFKRQALIRSADSQGSKTDFQTSKPLSTSPDTDNQPTTELRLKPTTTSVILNLSQGDDPNRYVLYTTHENRPNTDLPLIPQPATYWMSGKTGKPKTLSIERSYHPPPDK